MFGFDFLKDLIPLKVLHLASLVFLLTEKQVIWWSNDMKYCKRQWKRVLE